MAGRATPDKQLEIEEFIAHFGVKGMRWGVRKEERSVRREAAAKKYDIKAETFQRQINDLNRTPAKTRAKQRSINNKTEELSKLRDRNLRDAQAKRSGKLTRRQKQVLVGAALVAAYATYKVVDSGEFNRQVMAGKAFLDGNRAPMWKRAPGLSNPDWDASTLKFMVADKINPDYGAIGTKVNCRRCTFAYEMRRRGFDVAATRTTSGYGQNAAGLYNAFSPGKRITTTSNLGTISKASIEQAKKAAGKAKDTEFSDALHALSLGRTTIPKADPIDQAKTIFEALATQPNGARGELGVKWAMGGGHSLAWEIVKGKPVIFDTQSGSMYEDVTDFMITASTIGDAAFSRLDNVALNDNFLMRWVKDA